MCIGMWFAVENWQKFQFDSHFYSSLHLEIHPIFVAQIQANTVSTKYPINSILYSGEIYTIWLLINFGCYTFGTHTIAHWTLGVPTLKIISSDLAGRWIFRTIFHEDFKNVDFINVGHTPSPLNFCPLELHISRRENGKREMATGKFPGGKWPFSREISRFWPKLA